MARVGVVIAAYNAAETIDEALESLLNQEYEDWEALIVDDASTDNTAERVRPYLRDQRLRYVRNSANRGPGASRNFAMETLQTELIAPLDADDICMPTRFARQVAVFDNNPHLTLVGAQMAVFGDWGGPEESSRWPLTNSEIREELATKMAVAHGTSMYKREAALAVGGYDDALRRAQDLALMLRLRDAEAVFAALPSVELLYRTQRPVSLGYVIRSGHGGYLARQRIQSPGTDTRLPPGRRILIDLRSVVTWGRLTVKKRSGLRFLPRKRKPQ